VITRAVDLAARSLLGTFATVGVIGLLAIAAGVALGLTRTGATGLYFVMWWVLLFAILPVRIASQAELGTVVAGTEPGAPASPALRERAIWTSIVSAVVFTAVAALFPLTGL
jgi:predicted secreted protein